RLEAVLVEVVARPLAGTEDEIAFEVGRRDERLAELRVAHSRSRRRQSRPFRSSLGSVGPTLIPAGGRRGLGGPAVSVGRPPPNPRRTLRKSRRRSTRRGAPARC